MKGRKKIITMLFAMIALVSSALFALGDTAQKISYVRAVEVDGFSAQYDPDVLFSVERVYMAKEEERSQPLLYNDYYFNAIDTASGVKYFGDYGLVNASGYGNKDVVRNGGFVKLNEDVEFQASSIRETAMGAVKVPVKQGVMITFGGYVRQQIDANTSTVVTNASIIIWKDKNNDQIVDAGEVTKDGADYTLASDDWNDGNGDGKVQEDELLGFQDNYYKVYTGQGSNMTYVSVNVKLNGEEKERPAPRTYLSEYQDWTWFIDAEKENEGHYELEFSYMKDGNSYKSTFDFYLLLESSYSEEVEVNSISYSPKPTIEYARQADNWTETNKRYMFNQGTQLQFPTLVYDYTRYQVDYTFVSGDLHKDVKVRYNQQDGEIEITTTVYDDPEVKSYPVVTDYGNHIATLMFADSGKYTFDIHYIYNNDLVIDKSQLNIGNMSLDIYGYQLKYSRAGFIGADMTYLEIAQNGTTFILTDGYTSANRETSGDMLGVNYKIVTGNYRTGKIISNQSQSGLLNGEFTDDHSSMPDSFTYPKTDKGLWLTLNDEYVLTDSVYYYKDATMTKDELDDLNANKITETALTKVTTFTAPGYYIVKAHYKYQEFDSSGAKQERYGWQYMAFQITSATPQLSLYKTENTIPYDSDDKNFYANEYTNQNVFASWEDRGVFESKISGKLYYSTSGYPTEEQYLVVANGGTSTIIKSQPYNKNTVLQTSGSYMLVLEVEKSATKTYTYFTIDKERITGLQVYEVISQIIDNRAMYRVARNSNQEYITHTSSGVINTHFTLGWDDKPSRANIVATYKFTQFVKTDEDSLAIEERIGQNTYIYKTNQYKVGGASSKIQITKPINLDVALTADNVLTDQGIYEIELQDEAGNKLYYIIIVDRTNAVVTATHGDQENPPAYTSGEKVAVKVNLNWGTHKAIDLSGITANDNTTLYNLLHRNETANANALQKYYEDYYLANNSGTNWNSVINSFKLVSGGSVNQLYVVKNKYTQIKEAEIKGGYYLYSDGDITLDGQEWQTLVTDGILVPYNNVGITINVDKNQTRYYTIAVVGENQADSNINISFNVTITPDKALGSVYSRPAGNVDGQFDTILKTSEKALDADQTLLLDNYSKAQASNDGQFVFEWAKTEAGVDKFEVTNVKYYYYELMSNAELMAVTNKEDYPFYPYQFAYDKEILTTVNGEVTVKDFGEETRDGKTIYRSNAINLGYETYYEGENLVSRSVTQTGLYIITRELTNIDDGGGVAIDYFSYAYFVDRNAIVGYSISNVAEKLVGQFIHVSMPTSTKDGNKEINYDNFTKQGLISQTLLLDANANYLNYKLYVETNKMPTQLKVPSGKYVSGTYSNNFSKIVATSYNSLNLQLTIYFKDTYKILPSSVRNNGAVSFKIMEKAFTEADGNINLKFASTDIGLLSEYKNARVQADDNMLSLPGEYIFVINDKVGTKLANYEVVNYNTFTFGIKLTKVEPVVPLYAYSKINDKYTSVTNAVGKELYTNQEFVDFELKYEDFTSYNAQIDTKNLTIYRINKKDPSKVETWFRMINDKVDTGATIKEKSIINTDDPTKMIVKLNTGLKVEDDKIVSYEEYIYTIEVQFILENSDVNGSGAFYTYKQYVDDGNNTGHLSQMQFYKSTYTVDIDRTPNKTNINNLLDNQQRLTVLPDGSTTNVTSEQRGYFTQYQQFLTNEYNDEQNADEGKVSLNKDGAENINHITAYRSSATHVDYYAFTNDLYYQFVNNNAYNYASRAMYAISVDENTIFNDDGLSAVYYRKIELDSALDAGTRMSLLPICDTYFINTSGFYGFTENSTSYSIHSMASTVPRQTYLQLIYQHDTELSYGTYETQYYEVIEKDKAGNYTQYVIYFEPDTDSRSVTLDFSGYRLDKTAYSEDTIKFKQNDSDIEQPAYIKQIDDISVDNITYLGSYYAYGNITIYDGADNKEAEIYVDSKTENDDIYTMINNIVNNQGNHKIVYTDVYGQQFKMVINTFETAENELNISTFNWKEDAGQKYITLSDVNTPIAENIWWYVTKVEIKYVHGNGEQILTFNATNNNGITQLSAVDNYEDIVEVVLRAPDMLLLQDDIDYIISLTDLGGGNPKKVTLSTRENYYPHKFDNLPDNIFVSNNVVYSACDILISYNYNYYTPIITLDNALIEEVDGYYIVTDDQNGGPYRTIKLLADLPRSAGDMGSIRTFKVTFMLEDEESANYRVVIDTTTTAFSIKNTRQEDKIDFVKSTFNNTDANYTIAGLSDGKYFGEVISETVNISWSRVGSDYFIYTYDLYEFTNQYEYTSLIKDGSESYTLGPKSSATGKYVLVVTIQSKMDEWIATRVFGIAMSTTISGLYEVKNAEGSVVEHSALTNLTEVKDSLGTRWSTAYSEFGFGSSTEMNQAVSNFGTKTAVRMYIAKNKIIDPTDSNYAPALTLHSNKDNGVDAKFCEFSSGTALIKVYHVYRSNYRTFVVIMEVQDNYLNQDIIDQLTFSTAATEDKEQNLLDKGFSAVIYDNEALYYRLKINSSNKNNNSNLLEAHNRIVVYISYNDSEGNSARQIIGSDTASITTINFKNSGSYTLRVQDLAGNVQKFRTANSEVDRFTIILMKKNDILYTINDKAPIQYAFYNDAVKLQINRSNEATGVNNYDINSIKVSVNMNGNPNYKGYDHPTESSVYTFTEYGTYLVEIKANLLSTGEEVSSQIVFTILNPNEARTAIDFTSIYGYEIVSVFSVTKTTERDVTEKFVGMLQDRANVEGLNVYNKLVTYERLVETFGTATQGKMKFKMVYRVNDDELLPQREVEFAFTLNNEKPTITCSVAPGKSTTKKVVLKFNAANIYGQVGECNLVINGEEILRIDENSSSGITQVTLSAVGEYYVQIRGDSGNVSTSFNFTIKEPLNTVSIILIVSVVAIILALVGTFIWLRTRMKVR